MKNVIEVTNKAITIRQEATDTHSCLYGYELGGKQFLIEKQYSF